MTLPKQIAYYKEHGYIPAHHIVKLRREVVERDPWIVKSLMTAFTESKKLWVERRRHLADTTPFLHGVLSRWHALTGCPVLAGASLSGPGEPLAETAEHAIGTLRRTGLHALALPPYLIRKRDEPPVPGEDWQPPARPV